MDQRELDDLLEFLLDPLIVRDERLRTTLRARAREWLARHAEPERLPRRSERVVLGIDVSAAHGLDVVLLGTDLRPTKIANLGIEGLERFIVDHAPDVVAIDSPPAWARTGRSRRAERDLARLGVSAYAVPSDGLQTPFHAWMRVGFEAFLAAERAGYPRYVDGPVARTALEVFPYVSAVAFAGYRPKIAKARERAEWRRTVLAQSGVDIALLRTTDQVDAALAALTALRSLDGNRIAVGDPDEGVIVLPIAELPEGGWPLRAA
jgi:predicted nuclease with RNAse H fold